ncbi:MAG: outer membrane beta-barrel protein [Alphaproteobacteria bacterium]|nr:outer membrane beta-barrel protein [Alphaproteobacteria bacterium]
MRSRGRPQYDPLGIDLDQILLPPEGWDFGLVPSALREAVGSFTLMPSIEVKRQWVRNIFRLETGVKSDRILVLTPAADLRSEWGRHSLNVHGDISWGIHDRQDGENYLDFNTTGDLKLDITGDLSTTFSVGHARSHEQRGSPDDLGPTAGGTPISFESFGRIGSEFDNDSILIRGSLEGKNYNFRSEGETNSDDRERMENTGILRLGYVFYPGTTFFVEGEGTIYNYYENIDSDGFMRDSWGWEGLAGITYDLSGVSFLELSAGYLRKWYKDTELNTINGIAFTGKLIWNPTDFMTLTGSLDRRVNETTTIGTSGILTTTATMAMDYEILDNLLYNLNGSFKNENFDTINRVDRLWTIGTDFRYLVGHNLVADVSYDYQEKNSKNLNSSWFDHTYEVNLRFQM